MLRTPRLLQSAITARTATLPLRHLTRPVQSRLIPHHRLLAMASSSPSPSPSSSATAKPAAASPGAAPVPAPTHTRDNDDHDDSSEGLAFTSLNDDKPTTIVLLHGAMSSSHEFALVTPHLANYHILLPDLPAHGRSRTRSVSTTAPPTIEHSASLVADLIRKHAHGGSAHVVGLSMGGFVAQRLALSSSSSSTSSTSSSSLVRSLFLSGACPFAGSTAWMARRPSLIYYSLTTMVHWFPDRLYWWAASATGLQRHEELLADMRRNLTYEMIRDVYTSIVPYSLEDVGRLPGRVLAVAGGKQDDVATTAKMGEVLAGRGGGDGGVGVGVGVGDGVDGDGMEGRAVVVKKASHAWDLQFPELFAAGIRAWVEGEPLPEEFEKL